MAQSQSDYIKGDVLIRLDNNGHINDVLDSFKMFEGQITNLKASRELSKHLKIWLLSFNKNIPHERFLDELYRNPNITEVQSNHVIELRNTTPNDSLFNQQWQYVNVGQSGGTIGVDMKADLAWDVTTGGLTPLGDTIVVAVIDDGFDMNHPDLVDNLWFNYNEIPNNNIDDDNNGFIDDYQGWNVDLNNDFVNNGNAHGTAVAGIVGAKGNNGTGVTGVNWTVKIMAIQLFTKTEANIIQAYDYTLQNRMLYNQTNGTNGAFVVATNSSWGITQGQPSQYPLWCAMYDSLGAHGILNAGATTNSNNDVDAVGDMPTACPSDYLISVTNLNHNGQKVVNAGYGTTMIDLGAFGQGVFTLDNNGYGTFGGTSGATPHVAGMIGLLYSTPCVSFAILSKTNPDSAAYLAKQYIMNGVIPEANLNGITVTGGRLSMSGAIQELLNDCNASNYCFKPYSLNVTNISDTSAALHWDAFIDTTTNFNVQYRIVGVPNWTTVMVSDTILSYHLTGLNNCETYEFRVEIDCDTSLSGYTLPLTFQTDGCCKSPDDIILTSSTDSTAIIGWNSILAAQSYNLRYRALGTTNWTNITNLTTTNHQLIGLSICTMYEVELQTNCADSTTIFGTTFTFTTACGFCTSLPYCTSAGNSVNLEWIEEVIIGDINNNSGTGTTGYSDFTNLSTTLGTGQIYPISLTQGYSGAAFTEYFAVWIDFNQNGIFDNNEQVYTSNGTTTFPNIGNIVIPANASLGSTRMRVSMKYNDVPTACENFQFGEVEDYCVNIVDGGMVQCTVPTNVTTTLTAVSATFSWDNMPFAIDYDVQYREVGTTNWTVFPTINNGLLVSNLSDCTDFEYQVRTNCGVGNVSNYSALDTFSTICNCNDVTDLDTVVVNQTDAILSWTPTTNNVSYLLDYRPLNAPNWITQTTGNTSFQLFNLQPATTYEARIRIICTGNVTTLGSNVVTFYTDWTTSTRNLPIDIDQLSVYPNPFNESIQVVIGAANSQDITIEVFDMSGKLVIITPNQNVNRGTNTLSIATNDLNQGVYILKITTEKGVIAKRVIKTVR